MAVAREEMEERSGGSNPFINKFIYPEFAGAYGERLLNTIMQAIITKAMHYTWMDSVYFQKPGNPLYAGTSKIAEVRKTTTRKIEMDFQSLEERGLLSISRKIHQEKNANGQIMSSIRPYKNFDALYALAHEFYEWQKSGNYALLPPSWELADAIRQDETLYRKLVRFECYRRVLECKRPGRKKQGCSSVQQTQEECNPKEYSFPLSPYRSYENSITSFENSNRSAITESERKDACLNPTTSYSQNEAGPDYTTKNVEESGCGEMKPETMGVAQAWGAEQAAKREEKKVARQEAKAQYVARAEAQIAERVEAIKRQVAAEKDALHKTLMPRKHSHFNYEVCAMMQNFTSSLHDEATLERSNMTWGLDRFRETGLEAEDFIQLLYVCYAGAWKQTNVHARNKAGKINRMPVFRGIMRREIAKLGSGVMVIAQSCETAGAQLSCHTVSSSENVEEEQVMTVQDTQIIEIRQENNTSVGEESRQVLQANKNEVAVEVVEQQNVVRPSAELFRRQKAGEAMKALREFVYDSLWTKGDCLSCSCPIATKGGRCVVCHPLQEWDASKQKRIQNVIATIPTLEEARAILQL